MIERNTYPGSTSGTLEQCLGCLEPDGPVPGCSTLGPYSSCPAGPWPKPSPGRSSVLPPGSFPDNSGHTPKNDKPLLLLLHRAAPVKLNLIVGM